MKKLSIIILSLILLFCFVSCEKDKSGEMIENYEAFVKAYKVCNYTFSALPNRSSSSSAGTSGVTNVAEKYSEASDDHLSALYSTIHEDSNITITKITGGSGTYEYTYDDNAEEDILNLTVTYNNVILKYTYTDADGTEKNDGEMKISEGTYKRKTSSIDDTSSKGTSINLYDVKCNMTIEGTTYEITYTKKGSTFTSATVNGKEVQIRLLNAKN